MWLQVSTKGEYGVRIMVDLARHYGERPRSLTEIARRITGAHWSGPRFFGLRKAVAQPSDPMGAKRG